MQENTNEELQLRIRDLEKEVARLHAQIKKQRYGLVWLDVPEGFESETENKIPILEEVKDKAIKNDDGKPTHILIEGDNYHALTCLNYTHKGKVDVIYIDPPYNTGSDGFTYKDKRILKEFPDGTPVPKDHPMRHSYWLSFMSKRLELAKNLLSDKGVIFISIGDDEQANLELLCNKIFGETNRIENYIWESTFRPDNSSPILRRNTEYVLCYANNINKISYFKGVRSNTEGMPSLTKAKEKVKEISFPAGVVHTMLPNGVYQRGVKDNGRNPKWELLNDIEVKDGFIVTELRLKGHSYWASKEKISQELLDGTEIWIKSEAFVPYCKKTKESMNRPTKLLDRDVVKDYIFSNSEFKYTMFDKNFNNPKPTSLVSFLCDFIDNKTSTILDFFAGSGTTMHAVMKLNEEDGGKRQCILVQQKENEQNICESVTYERNRRVIQGYTNSKNEKVEGLGNSLKYYKTGFVGKNNSNNATDSDKVELSLKAGYLLALAENTLEEVSRNDFYQIFEDGKGRITAVYFKGSMMKFGEFSREIESWLSADRKNTANVYIFCWGDVSIYENEFEDMSRISLKAIPKPILDIYKSINC